MPLTPLVALMVGLAGAAAGGLGALLGIGGGVFLVPFLNDVVGLPLSSASGVGLMTVMATSSIVAAGPSRDLINLRLGMCLQVAAGAGALAGAHSLDLLPPRVVYAVFALVTAGTAVLTLSRLDRRNVIVDPSAQPGLLGGRYYEEESGREIVYRIRRLPAALVISLTAGFVSGLLGIGGGILLVPAINGCCGVPLRAAAATSAAMLGVTALASAPVYYARGEIAGPAAAAAVLGVLIGTRVGFWFGDRARARSLKVLMAVILAAVSLNYVMKIL